MAIGNEPKIERNEKLAYELLCADDEKNNQMILERVLGPMYSSVKVVASGDILLAEIQATPSCACVVSDNNMPGMKGIEILETLRKEGNHVPFVLWSGDGDSDSTLVSRVLALGGIFLGKPCPIADLRSTVKQAIEAKENH